MAYAKIFDTSLVRSAYNFGGKITYMQGISKGCILNTRFYCIWSKAKTKPLQISFRSYSLCCPPRPPPGCCGCPPQVPGGGRRIVPPADCTPGPIPPNPCCPKYYHGKNTYKRYKYLFLFFLLPVIIFQSFNVLGNPLPHKGPCREYEYMRLRSKRFPWPGENGQGMETFFHNPHVNHLPEECEPPPLICD